MSALEMIANGEKITAGAAKKIDDAIGELLKAQKLISNLQGDHAAGSALWHRLETIDDRIHEALSLLGD